MSFRHTGSFLILLGLLLAAAPVLPAQDKVTEAARDVYQDYQDALVVITAVSTIQFTTDQGSLPDQQRTSQTLGTIISPDGLVVISNSALDLGVGMIGQRGREAGSGADEFVTVTSARSVFHEIQVNFSDGSEYNAARVSHDEDLDLAFLLLDQNQVKARTSPLTWLNISNRIRQGDLSIADRVIGLSRSSPVYGYIPSVIPGFVTAISKKPDRTYYVTTAGTAQGVPVFEMSGKFAGLTVQRIVEGKRTNLLGTLGAGTVETMANLAQATLDARSGE